MEDILKNMPRPEDIQPLPEDKRKIIQIKIVSVSTANKELKKIQKTYNEVLGVDVIGDKILITYKTLVKEKDI